MTTEILQTRPRLRYAYDELTNLVEKLGPNAQLPTMVQLREDLGVSMKTLHAALRELERQEILRSVHGVGIYVQPPKKRTLTGNIGFIGSAAFRAQKSPFYVHIATGVQEAAQQHQRHVMLLGTDRNWDVTSFSMVDGLLLSDHSDETNQKIKHAAPAGMPLVSMFTASEGMSCVLSDDYGGAKLAVRHLLELGHRRIACLMATSPLTLRGRFTGYCDALQAANITVEPDWMRLSDILPPQGLAHREWAYEQMEAWLCEGWEKTRCTALLVQNDQAAIGAMQLLQQKGIQIPAQVSVVGFDGTEICDYASPRLTSVQLPLEQMGREAVNLLVTQIEQEHIEPQTVIVPTRLHEGDSVAPPTTA